MRQTKKDKAERRVFLAKSGTRGGIKENEGSKIISAASEHGVLPIHLDEPGMLVDLKCTKEETVVFHL